MGGINSGKGFTGPIDVDIKPESSLNTDLIAYVQVREYNGISKGTIQARHSKHSTRKGEEINRKTYGKHKRPIHNRICGELRKYDELS